MGLTTAATIWIVAAIGMIFGAGYPLLALIATLTVFIVLHFLTPIEKRLRQRIESQQQNLTNH